MGQKIIGSSRVWGAMALSSTVFASCDIDLGVAEFWDVLDCVGVGVGVVEGWGAGLVYWSHDVHYIKEEDLKSICYREYFVEGSCSRNPCIFQHDFPRELRGNETVTNAIKRRQAAIKRRRLSKECLCANWQTKRKTTWAEEQEVYTRRNIHCQF